MASPDRDTRLKSIFQEEFLAHWQLTRQKTAEAQDTEGQIANHQDLRLYLSLFDKHFISPQGFPDRVKGFLDLALQRIQRDWLVPYWNVGWVPMSFIKWAEFYPLHLTQCVRLAWIGPRKPVESIQQWNRRAIQTALLGGHDAPFPGPSSRARTLSAPSLPQLLSNSLKGGSHQPCLIKESDWPRIYSTAFPFSLILSLHSISSYNQTGESYPRRSARKRTKTSNEPSSSSMTVSSSTTSDISLDAHHLAVYQTLEMLTARIIVRLMTQFMEGRIEKDVPECLGKTGLQTFFLEVSLRSMQLQKNGA